MHGNEQGFVCSFKGVEKMPWDRGKIDAYHVYAKTYVSNYGQKIDCADLAIAALVSFAEKESLPVRLKYYSGGWKWKTFTPGETNAKDFKREAMRDLGALNVIDNTKPVAVNAAKAGDLVMSKWSPTLGHTRIIYSVKYDSSLKKYEVIWYQGNLPPVVPEQKTDYFSNISGVFGGTPRRWNFAQFDN